MFNRIIQTRNPDKIRRRSYIVNHSRCSSGVFIERRSEDLSEPTVYHVQ